MPLPSTGLPTPLADMKDLYGLAEPADAAPSKSQKSDETAAQPSTSSSKLTSLVNALLRKKGDSGGIPASAARDSQETLTATGEDALKADPKA